MAAIDISTYEQFSTYLTLQGVVKIEANYSGSGDSGQIDEITFYDDKDQVIPMDDRSDLKDYIDNFLDERVLNRIEDWYNEEGGYGTATIHVLTGQIEVDNNIYIVESIHYGHSYNAFVLEQSEEEDKT